LGNAPPGLCEILFEGSNCPLVFIRSAETGQDMVEFTRRDDIEVFG
jgi:hypothetical protein